MVNSRGRPFGGKCWVIDNKFKVKSFEELSNEISLITLELDKEINIHIFGVWFPFDDNSMERLTILKSNLSLLESYIKTFKHENILITGDFNCDLNRGKRFDRALLECTKSHNLFDSLNIFNQQLNYTYFNSTYTASLDHIFVNLKCLAHLTGGRILNDSLNMSDHLPVFCELNFEIPQSFPDLQKKDFFHKFPWKNANYKVIYSSIVSNNFTVLFNEIEKIDDPKLTIDYIVESFPKIMIKSARQAEKNLGYITSNGVKRKCFSSFSDEIGREIKVLIFNIKNNKLDQDKQRIYRKRLRQLQRVNIHNNFRNKSIQ